MLKNFRLNIIFRVLLITMTALVLVWVLANKSWFFTPLVAGVVLILLVANLISYVERTNKNLTQFLQSIKQGGFTNLFKDKNNIIQTEIEINLDNNKTASLILKKNKDIFSNRILAILIETTEQVSIKDQFHQSQKMQSVGQLAGGIAHDFNNVLTAIIVSTDLLILRHKPEDLTFKELQAIKDNAQRAAGIVRQLLAYSRQQNFNIESISLTDVLQEQTIRLLVTIH